MLSSAIQCTVGHDCHAIDIVGIYALATEPVFQEKLLRALAHEVT